jgi:hypothetical protein
MSLMTKYRLESFDQGTLSFDEILRVVYGDTKKYYTRAMKATDHEGVRQAGEKHARFISP